MFFCFLSEWNSGYTASAEAFQTSQQRACSFSGKVSIHPNWTAVQLVHWMELESCTSCTSFWGLGTDLESQAHTQTLNSQLLLFLLRSFLWVGSQNQKSPFQLGWLAVVRCRSNLTLLSEALSHALSYAHLSAISVWNWDKWPLQEVPLGYPVQDQNESWWPVKYNTI